MLTKAVLDDPVIHARLKGVGTLSKEDARDYAVTGPTARGSGVAIDSRHDDPYAAYGELDWSVITQEEGDVFATTTARRNIIVLKRVKNQIAQEDLRVLKEVEEAWKEIESGRFRTMEKEDFLEEIKEW